MRPGNRTGTGRKPGTFEKGDPRINRAGRPKKTGEVIERLLDMAPDFLAAMGRGLKSGDSELMRIWAKHVLPTAQQVEISGVESSALDGVSTEALVAFVKSSRGNNT